MAYRILLVENDATLRADYHRNLVMWGYEVVLAEGKGDALIADATEKAQQVACDLVLADLRLLDDSDYNDRSGFLLAMILAPRLCIIVTNHGSQEDLLFAQRHQIVFGYFYGPNGPEVLRKLIEGALTELQNQRLENFRARALLVGVNEYEDLAIDNLAFCVTDVVAVQQLLEAEYEAIHLLPDTHGGRPPTRANILTELTVVAEAAEPGDLLLFYFSGHGIAKGGESYLLPCDARWSTLKYTGVSVRDVREIMNESAARTKVIVLDACNSGTRLGKSGPGRTEEFIRHVFEEAQGIAIFASCAQDQEALESEEKGMGIFTYFLLEALSGKADVDNKGFVTVHDVSIFVANHVRHWAAENGRVQLTPTLELAAAGDIVLRLLRRSTIRA